MAQLAVLLAAMGSTVTASQFPSPWNNPEQRKLVETYFDLAHANNSISNIRLWSVPKVDASGTVSNDFWPFLLQLNSDDQSQNKDFFTSKSNTQAILRGIFGKDFTDQDYHVFDASTITLFLDSKTLADRKVNWQDEESFYKWGSSQDPAVKHLIRLPLAARIDPLAMSDSTGTIQAYCRNDGVCKEAVQKIAKQTFYGNSLQNANFEMPEMSSPCKDCKGIEYTVLEEKPWCAPKGVKSRIGECNEISQENLHLTRGKNRITIDFKGSLAERQTVQLYLATMAELSYISTSPQNVPLLASSSRSVQGGGHHGSCHMLRDHDINGRGYTIGLVDMGIDMKSSFFIDGNFPTPCSRDTGEESAIYLDTCNNVGTNADVFTKADSVQVGGTKYLVQPLSRKVTSIVVHGGADGTIGSSHGTSVAATINGALSKETRFKKCPSSLSSNRGVAYSAKLSLYDVGAYSSDGWSISAPEEDYKKMFAVAHAVGAHEFVVPFGSQSGGRYTPLADDIDSFMSDHRDALVVVAAGNGGSISSGAVSKNALAVGAVNQAFTGPADFTSKGPTHAGLLKPDVLAPGSNVEVPVEDLAGNTAHCEVAEVSGTSISAGFIGGAATLVREYFERGYYPSGVETSSDKISNISAATIKAVLVNSARQRPVVAREGATCKTTDNTGHGSVHLENSLPFADNHDYEMHMFQGTAYASSCKHGACIGGKPGGDQQVGPSAAQDVVLEFDIEAKNPNVPVSATLAWIDPQSVRGAQNKVVQNIQLEIEAPGGGIWKQQSIKQCNGIDHAFAPVENTQKVIVQSPRQNTVYTVRVRKKFVFESQEFSVVVSGGSVKKEDAQSLLCCPEGSVATYAGCFGLDSLVLTILCVIIGVAAIVALILLHLNAKKRTEQALKQSHIEEGL